MGGSLMDILGFWKKIWNPSRPFYAYQIPAHITHTYMAWVTEDHSLTFTFKSIIFELLLCKSLPSIYIHFTLKGCVKWIFTILSDSLTFMYMSDSLNLIISDIQLFNWINLIHTKLSGGLLKITINVSSSLASLQLMQSWEINLILHDSMW